MNRDNNWRKFKASWYYLAKGIIKNYNVIINGRNFCDHPIDSDIKRSEKIRKLTTGRGEDYTRESLLDHEYMKNHYRLLAVDVSGQKELAADPKTIQPIEFIGKLRNVGTML